MRFLGRCGAGVDVVAGGWRHADRIHARPLAPPPPPPRQDTSATSMLLDAMSASAAQQAAWAKGPGPYTQEQCPVTFQEQQASPAGPDPGARYACWAPPFTYADPLLNLFLP